MFIYRQNTVNRNTVSEAYSKQQTRHTHTHTCIPVHPEARRFRLNWKATIWPEREMCTILVQQQDVSHFTNGLKCSLNRFLLHRRLTRASAEPVGRTTKNLQSVISCEKEKISKVHHIVRNVSLLF